MGLGGGEREAGGAALFLRKKETPTESALTVRASNLFSHSRVQFPAISEQAVLTLSIFDAGRDVKENDELGAFDALRFGCKPVLIAKCFTTCGEGDGR